MSDPTTISVRVLAYGGKFIGSHVGFANVAITDAQGATLASGLCDQDLVAGTDGSGVVSLIMGQPYPWGYPVRADQATEFTTALELSEPTVLTFTATSAADPRISVSVSRTVLPGAALTGAAAVVLVMQGLLVGVTAPAAGSSIPAGAMLGITAQVKMMCGCLIDNLFWPAANFTVQAVITDNNGNVTMWPLTYSGDPSYFSGVYTLPAGAAGDWQIGATAIEMNGNCGGSLAPVTITVTDVS
jgi:hypothetical protein